MSIILLGYRGCGKTTIGKRMANRLWQDFVDTDEMVAKGAGKTIRQIFEQDGEQRFRDLEVEAVKQACARNDIVIALGGGAVLREENRALLKDSSHKRLYLACSPEELLKRINSDPSSATTRPHLTAHGGGIEEIRQLVAEREPLYREVKTAELDVSNLTPDEAMVYIVRLTG
jgi:shikimate kinase